ncbi:Secretory pathway Sec39 [Penicillium sp. DV-2018c]|nr:Secretory pathway Sec39 [Penicillium sp. DV-2018c]
MELLSLSLILVPSADPLPEILGAWRRCDEELSSLRTREQAEEDLWDAKGDTLSSVPGGFGPTDSERDAFETEQQRAARRARARNALPSSTRHEAPMGLFEVARGAALALHKNAFPLSGGRGVSGEVAGGNDGGGGGAERPLSPDSERVRKRDVVSNMVTGGLVSGIGWVLGADPVGKK